MVSNTGNDELVFRTKAGNEFIVWGSKDDSFRSRFGKTVLRVLNNNFTLDEIRAMNVIVNTDHAGRSDGYAQLGDYTVAGKKKKRVILVEFGDDAYDRVLTGDAEYIITHELVHARRYAFKEREVKQEEHSVEFETVGRVSYAGLRKAISGYYYNSPEVRHLPHQERVRAMLRGMMQDRKLLNGDVKKKRSGKLLVQDVRQRFRTAWINSR